MDFDRLDVRTSANRGSFLHLEDPYTDEPLWHVPPFPADIPEEAQEDWSVANREAVGIMLRGADAKEIQAIQHEQNARRVRQKGVVKQNKRGGVDVQQAIDTVLDRLTPEEQEKGSVEQLVAATINFQHVESAGVVITPDVESCGPFYAKHPWVREQAFGWINDRANYLGESLAS